MVTHGCWMVASDCVLHRHMCCVQAKGLRWDQSRSAMDMGHHQVGHAPEGLRWGQSRSAMEMGQTHVAGPEGLELLGAQDRRPPPLGHHKLHGDGRPRWCD
ncbi:hypothetical protein Fot_06517 [Forsythia ovata]|uniref:Uncharacterized protein n=1 Tax=Forsythia ovata TaxID=205694 RepID=A0ABD1WT71_9LAMI